MPIETKFERVEEDDPNRCQATHKQGQCAYKAMEHSKYCAMHGGNKAQEARKIQIIRQYNLAQWQSRVNDFADSDQVKTLRDEIGITRLLLENMLQRCRDQDDLLLYSSKIAELVGKIEKLVVSCNRLESSMGMLLDKAAALNLAGQIVEIIARYVEDGDAIDAIAGEIASTIANLNGAEVKS
jgi:hypothetical protein